MNGLSAYSIGLLIFCIISEIVRELCLKAGVDNTNARLGKTDGWRSVRALFANPLVLLSNILWAVELIVWVRVLEVVPLGIAFPSMALMYAGVPLASALFLKEKLTLRRLSGAALITAGVACVAITGI